MAYELDTRGSNPGKGKSFLFSAGDLSEGELAGA
jgi:hypothetical protein